MNDTERSTLPSRMRRAIACIACVAVAAACGADSATSVTPDDAARAVDLFAHLADSVSRAGGDADVGGAYASLAEAVRQGGRIAPVVITVDGVPTTFLATAQQTEIELTCPSDYFCAAIYSVSTLRTLMAWQQDDPRRVVQLASAADSNPIRAYLFPTLVPFPTPSASLVYFDGKGGTYFGTSGSQKVAMAPSSTLCTSAGPSKPVIAIFPAPPRCTEADFAISFNAKAEPSTFLSKNSATGSHTFSMPAQTVLGARLQLVGYGPPLPPIVVPPSAPLPAILTAKVDSLVTLTLTVSNPSSAPATVTFNSGQHYDFTISDASTGALVWRWGMGMMFTQMVSSETVPANGTLVYTAQWKPSRKGSLIATGSLVSASHRADAKVAISLP